MRASAGMISTAIALPLLLGLGATALQAGEPIADLNAADAAPSDNFGAALAVSGTTAIVASPRDDVSGTLSGSAYLFDVSTGLQTAKLVPNDGAPFDSFGFAVSISGNVAIVSAYKDDDSGLSSGSVSIFDSTTGLQTGKLLADDGSAGDFFGFAVGISNAIAVIGTPGDDDLGNSAGSAYVFDTSTGLQLFKLTASDAAANDLFGNSIAIAGNTIIVGAPGKNSSAGAAYLFDATTGLQFDKLTPSGPQTGAYFGRAVAVEGNHVVVGAPFASFGVSSVGLAYLFDTTTGTQLALLKAGDGATSDRFGESVAISSGQILVGAWAHSSLGPNSGAAYVFDVTTGQQTSKLSSTDGKAGDRFGVSVGLSGERAVLGALAAFGATVNSGSAFGFQLTGDIWSNLGQGKHGLAGVPSLLGVGDLTPASDLSMAVGRSAPAAQAFLILGVNNLSAPFKGGVLVPSPDVVVPGFTTDGAGQLVLDTVWPAGAASGVPLYLQFWIMDVSASQLFSATNGINKSTP